MIVRTRLFLLVAVSPLVLAEPVTSTLVDDGKQSASIDGHGNNIRTLDDFIPGQATTTTTNSSEAGGVEQPVLKFPIARFYRHSSGSQSSGTDNERSGSGRKLRIIRVTAIHVERAEFAISKSIFGLTLRLGVEAANKRLEDKQVRLSLSLRSASSCSSQFAAALAAEEYYTRRSRLFIVSGCDDAIKSVARMATVWRVPVMTAAGFGLDLNDKTVYSNLVRVAFSMRSAIEFLVRILRTFQWRRLNLIVDESDPNSVALRKVITGQLASLTANTNNSSHRNSTSSNSSSIFQVSVNQLVFNLQALSSPSEGVSNHTGSHQNVTLSGSNRDHSRQHSQQVDRWPNDATNSTVRELLRQSSVFSRITVLLVAQSQVRKFMLSAHEQGMANGLYTFITIPLLLSHSTERSDQPGGPAEGDRQEGQQTQKSAHQFQPTGFSTSTGDELFIWRANNSTRNQQARQAFESLMAIYLRMPTTKQFVYFANSLSSLANMDSSLASQTQEYLGTDNNNNNVTYLAASGSNKQLQINSYTASFYDCLQVYSIALLESLATGDGSNTTTSLSGGGSSTNSWALVHRRIGSLLCQRHFENMVTGTIYMNENCDREADYTLDDLNQMTGKFRPVMLFKGETREMERLARIHWSSDPSVGQSVDSAECHLDGSCESRPVPRFLINLALISVPLLGTLAGLIYFVYSHISLESQLVDYWWRLGPKDVELLSSRRRQAGDGGCGSTLVSSVGGGHSSHHSSVNLGTDGTASAVNRNVGKGLIDSEIGAPSNQLTSTEAGVSDVCYGRIILANHKLAKIALKPTGCKFQQSRKLMIELRTIRPLSHQNLCRFVGILIEEQTFMLAAEFCPKGSLREFFQNDSMVIDWTFRCSIMNDVGAGLAYLHQSGIEFHGRLKSSNCLVSARFVVKLSDYGPHSLYERLDEAEDEDSLLAKRLWMAPEQLKSAGTGSKLADIYSFGLLLFEIITSRRPFYVEASSSGATGSNNELVRPIKELLEELRNHGPSEELGLSLECLAEDEIKGRASLIDLMRRCWSYEAKSRPTTQELMVALKKITKGVTSKKLLENLTGRMEQYTNNLESLVEAKLATLLEEKQKTEGLLYQFVPKSIAIKLSNGDLTEPEAYDCVTVFYSDIVGFTSLSSKSTPIEMIDFLCDVYQCFDETLEQYDIFKVDTIGDAYIVASGLPQRNGDKHAIEIACAALDIRSRLTKFEIAHEPGKRLEMRVGIHSGPCVAGVVGGLEMPKYCIFGETVSIGKFMESSGQPMKIHVTEESKALLDKVGGFLLEPRTPKITRDGLPFQTYWLERA